MSKSLNYILLVSLLLLPAMAHARIVNVTEYKFNLLPEAKVTGSCENVKMLSKPIDNATCQSTKLPNIGTCYRNCKCKTGFKEVSGACVAKTCADYELLTQSEANASHKVCFAEETALGNNKTNCYTCNNTCLNGYKLSGGNCVALTCNDYGWQASSCNSTQNQVTHNNVVLGSSKGTCYECTSCGAAYKYACTASTSTRGGVGTQCGGKYTQCECNTNYAWDSASGTCSSLCVSCNTTTFPLTTIPTNANYETCTPQYCSDTTPRYKFTGCKTGYVDWDVCYTVDGVNYGPLSYWTAANMGL